MGLAQQFQPPELVRASAVAKEGAADADDGGTLLDGGFEIMTHAHGQTRQGDGALVLQVIAQLTKPDKVGPGFFGIGIEGGNAHQSLNADMAEGEEFGEGRAKRFFLKADLGSLVAKIHLEIDGGMQG